MVLRAADYLRSEVNQQTYSVLTPLPSDGVGSAHGVAILRQSYVMFCLKIAIFSFRLLIVMFPALPPYKLRYKAMYGF
mgnify:CR=1 FL=1